MPVNSMIINNKAKNNPKKDLKITLNLYIMKTTNAYTYLLILIELQGRWLYTT